MRAYPCSAAAGGATAWWWRSTSVKPCPACMVWGVGYVKRGVVNNYVQARCALRARLSLSVVGPLPRFRPAIRTRGAIRTVRYNTYGRSAASSVCLGLVWLPVSNTHERARERRSSPTLVASSSLIASMHRGPPISTKLFDRHLHAHTRQAGEGLSITAEGEGGRRQARRSPTSLISRRRGVVVCFSSATAYLHQQTSDERRAIRTD